MAIVPTYLSELLVKMLISDVLTGAKNSLAPYINFFTDCLFMTCTFSSLMS
jgi:hypothetical protein